MNFLLSSAGQCREPKVDYATADATGYTHLESVEFT